VCAVAHNAAGTAAAAVAQVQHTTARRAGRHE
jgi:hypothetical protein